MSDQKPTNDDILSRIRGGAKPAADKPASADAPTANPAEASAPPAGTADILSSIKGGAAAPKPAGTADILSSIKGGAAAAKPKAAAPAGTASILDSIKGGGAPKPAAAAPKGTSSILDSIKGGGAAKPAAAASAGKAAAKPVADTAKAAGLSAADMIKAARTGVASPEGQVVAAESPKKVALPSKPLVKPAAGGAAAKASVARRSFLSDATAFIFSPVVIAWGSLVTATAASSLAMARFMMPNVLVEPPTKFKIGPPTDYGASTVSTKWKAQFGVWIVNDEIDGQQMIYALSTVCTHLGCTPNWLEGEQKFKCPCHGSGFYKSGVNFEGPAPRPLERHGIRLAEDGMLEVDKSVKFQKELGQWDIAACFVPV